MRRDGAITQGALALFGIDRWGDYPQFLLKMGRFRGTLITGDILHNRQEHMNAFTMMREGLAYLERTLPLASLANGRVVVTWEGGGDQDGSSTGIFARVFNRFAANGQPSGTVTTANVAVCTVLEAPAVALSADGQVVIGWSANGYGTTSRVVLRRFAANDSPLYH